MCKYITIVMQVLYVHQKRNTITDPLQPKKHISIQCTLVHSSSRLDCRLALQRQT
jgi:hypothetical protein